MFAMLILIIDVLVMCDIRTNARINVEEQGVRAQSERLPENDAVSKVATDHRPAWYERYLF